MEFLLFGNLPITSRNKFLLRILLSSPCEISRCSCDAVCLNPEMLEHIPKEDGERAVVEKTTPTEAHEWAQKKNLGKWIEKESRHENDLRCELRRAGNAVLEKGD